MLNPIVSQKIKISSFFLIIMVVYIHSYNIKDNSGYLFLPVDFISIINIYFQNLISEGIARISVPIFFVISGYLFFKENLFNFSLYKQKIKNRLSSLLIPYLFWSSFVVTLYFILQSLPSTEHYFNSALIKNLSNKELLSKVFIDPINYPLWFLRDLMYLIIITPLFYIFIRYLHIPLFIILFILWFYGINQGTDFHFYKSEPFLFFAIGVYFAIKNGSFINYQISNKKFILVLLIYLSILFFKTYCYTYNIYTEQIIFMQSTSILLGIFLFWHMLDRIEINKFMHFSSYTFIFYVFHEPIMTIIKKAMYSILGKSSEVSLFLYLCTPIIILSFLVLLSELSRKYIPTFFSIITGGRVQ